MKTLVVYDNEGRVFTQITGEYVKPSGLKHIEVVIPEGKYVASVNPISMQPVFADLPKTEIDLLKLDLKATKLAMLELAESLMGGF